MNLEVSVWGQKPHGCPLPWNNRGMSASGCAAAGGVSLPSLLLQRALNVLTLAHPHFPLPNVCVQPSICLSVSSPNMADQWPPDEFKWNAVINLQRSCVKTRAFQPTSPEIKASILSKTAMPRPKNNCWKKAHLKSFCAARILTQAVALSGRIGVTFRGKACAGSGQRAGYPPRHCELLGLGGLSI